MRKYYKFALILLAIFFIYQYRQNRLNKAEKVLDEPTQELAELEEVIETEDEPEAEIEAKVEDKKFQLKPEKAKSIEVKSEPLPKPSAAGPPKVKPGHVLFEVKMGNWVVTQGDILMGKLKGQTRITTGQYKPPNPRLWPSARIPYVIDQEYPYVELIEDVIAYFHENTPIRFEAPKPSDRDGIIFKAGDSHCYSYLGRVGGFQPIFLAEECRGPQIVHEILHALGFVHEQSRSDRDDYLDISWQDIRPEFHMQFMKVPESFMIALKNTKFDYNSVMLYHATAFAKDSSVPVMKSKTDKKINPTREGLSPSDIERLYQIYGK